jgi:type IV pilus assembly protein PilN
VIKINLLSVQEAAQEAGRRTEGRLIGLGGVLMVVLLLALETFSRMQLAPLRAEHTNLEAALKALESKVGELTELERNRADLDEKLKTIAVLEQRKVGPVRVLSDLADAAPEQVWLMEFTENGGAATVTGMALDNQTIATFMRNLAGSPFFTSVDLVETTQSEQDGVQLKRFVVRARLSYAGQPLSPTRPDQLKYPDPPKDGGNKQRKDGKGRRA